MNPVDELKARVRKLTEKFTLALADEAKPEAVAEEVKFLTSKLEDGTEINTDAEEWAEGSNAYILTDGEKIDVPSGDYKLEDGTMLAIENGVVTAVTAAEAEATEEVEQAKEVKAEVPEAVKALVAEAVKALRTEMSAQIAGKDKELEALKLDLSTKAGEVTKLKAEFEHEGLPKGPATIKTKLTRTDIAKLPIKERVTAIGELYN